MLGSAETGLGSVETAGGQDDGSGSGGGGGPVWTGTGQLLTNVGGARFAYLGDPGLGLLASVDPGTNYTTANNYPTRQRTFQGLMATLRLGPVSHAPLTLTLYKNNAPTPMQVVFPIGSAAGDVVGDLAHPIPFVDGDVFDVRADSAANSEGALYTFSATLEGEAGGTGGDAGTGFGTPTFITQANSVDAQETTWLFENNIEDDAAGHMTTTNEVTTLLGGVPITMDFSKFNGRGRQNVTTAVGDHTPTVLWGGRFDLLVIILGDTITQITVDGMDLDADFQYEICWISGSVAVGSGITVVRLNGDINQVTGAQRFQNSGGAAAQANTTANFLIDNPTAATPAFARALVTGAPGSRKLFESHTFYQEGGSRWIEDDYGISDHTADVNTIELAGNMNAGDVITFRTTRLRAG